MTFVRSSLFIVLAVLLAACSQNPMSETLLEPQLTETQKITYPANDVQARGKFGYSVAIEGNLLVVGALETDIAENPNQGAVYLYQKDTSGTWQFFKKLVASDGERADYFGSSVATDGNTIVVGSPYDNIRGRYDQGSVYLFGRNQGGSNAWGEVKKLVASDGTADEKFGSSVAVRGDTVVVGIASNSGASRPEGSAYVFSRSRGGTNAWGQTKKLVASDGEAFDIFGRSVATDGNTVVIGALGDDIGINSGQGSAYIFERNAGGLNAWGEVKKLTASDGEKDDLFGSSVAINGNTVVVGAYNRVLAPRPGQGSAYIFERNKGGTHAWGEVKKLVDSDPRGDDEFGNAVAIIDNVIVVGAPGWNSNRGAAYIFQRNRGGPNNWGLFRKLLTSDRLGDNAGSSVAVSSDTAIMGIYGDNVDGNVSQGSVNTYDY
jgi:FG-GAP repeat